MLQILQVYRSFYTFTPILGIREETCLVALILVFGPCFLNHFYRVGAKESSGGLRFVQLLQALEKRPLKVLRGILSSDESLGQKSPNLNC